MKCMTEEDERQIQGKRDREEREKERENRVLAENGDLFSLVAVGESARDRICEDECN